MSSKTAPGYVPGMAVTIHRVDAADTPGVVREVEEIAHPDAWDGAPPLATRVVVEVDGGTLVNTDASRVEAF